MSLTVMKRAIFPSLKLEGPSRSDKDELPHMDDHCHAAPAVDGEHAFRITRVEPFADYPFPEPPRRLPRRRAEMPVFNVVKRRANQLVC